ncbi:MAG: hypothetical protein ABI777_04870 [Betaproteobacteria bacterium]
MASPVRAATKWFLFGVAAALLSTPVAAGEKRTVCTITVNSADEKEAFRRHLPAEKYQFVELVERGRRDWLASACSSGISCDILVISGHFDDGKEFFSDRVDAREFLPVSELDRVSCSDSCPGLFSRLKEVHLFGCNTLNPGAQRSTTGEIVRGLVRDGISPAEAERRAQALGARHSESSRSRMERIFKDVPVIYGFSSVAPLGPSAGSALDRYFQSAGTGEVGSGRASSRLLAQFASNSMTATRGMTATDAQAEVRRDVCQFSDDRLSGAQKLKFVHELMQRQSAEVRMFLDHVERYTTTIDEDQRRVPAFAAALQVIERDRAARERFLAFARDADQPQVRVRMLEVASTLGWLTPVQRQEELVQMMREMLAHKSVGTADVALACTLNTEGELDGVGDMLIAAPGQVDDVAHAAVRACLGSAAGHARTLQGLVSPAEADVDIAQAYLHQRPIADIDELREVTAGIARMRGVGGQVRALDALSRHRLSDPQSLAALTQMFPAAESLSVQNAIAGILIRADYRALARPELVQTLREHRRKSPYGADMIDALIRRLQLP